MEESLYHKDCIRTRSGLYMNVFEPTVEMVDIGDIAHALSNIPRFGGHLPMFFSVAQHSVLCSHLVPRKHALSALMHDSAEAYILDMPSPIKKRLQGYQEIEDNLLECISKATGFSYPFTEDIKIADQEQLEIEWHNLMLENGNMLSMCWTHSFAKHKFLSRYYELTKI